ncbi:hypothetical protein DTO164E3_1775 [Paecilomyces variotii]|nr:hypothetical protein DTO164E3_1775 [Paecilomyces variotii]KAJ9208450.1 hypothetical protein DTO032I3_427 [Paecilomyces variotii]KAJ9279986.1 hypothetical protein DTO021D3_3214 [Paecilomyces variotii]KAJ9284545.1 hypothetical protein DTO021C3_7880 [Paecilomyces variotii]KAJ9339602.1 hypothetical protein DTO027B6_7835 [Paecilomyces variotii]
MMEMPHPGFHVSLSYLSREASLGRLLELNASGDARSSRVDNEAAMSQSRLLIGPRPNDGRWPPGRQPEAAKTIHSVRERFSQIGIDDQSLIAPRCRDADDASYATLFCSMAESDSPTVTLLDNWQ